MKPNIGFIYKITNKINGKIYIGLTERTIKERWKGHINKTGCTYLHNAILKYGKENFSIEVLEEVPINLLNEKEIYWIAYYNSTDRAIGYNILQGGKLGRTNLSKLTKLEIDKLIDLDLLNIPHTVIAKMFNIERKTVTSILRRNTNYTRKYLTLSQRTDIEDIITYLKQYNPTMKDACNKFKIARNTLAKIAKSINYHFLTYNLRYKYLEYNSSKSVQTLTDNAEG